MADQELVSLRTNAEGLRRELDKARQDNRNQGKRIDKLDERYEITTVLESMNDDSSLSGGDSATKRNKGAAASGKAVQLLWERGSATAGVGADVPSSSKRKVVELTDNVYKGTAGGSEWNVWGSGVKGVVGMCSKGPAAANKVQATQCRRGEHQNGSADAADVEAKGGTISLASTGVTPQKYGSLSRPNVRPIGPLQFKDKPPPDSAIDLTSPPQQPQAKKRAIYGNPPLQPCMPTDNMYYFNVNTNASTHPLYDKDPVLVGKYGLRAYRMSGGGCIATFEFVHRTDGTRGLLPISSQLIKDQVQHRLNYLKKHGGLSTKFIAVPTCEQEWTILRLQKVLRDELLMQMSHVLAGAMNDRPLFLSKPVPTADGDRTPGAYMEDCPEPVRSIMILVTNGAALHTLDVVTQQKLVKDTLAAARQMLGPLRNGFPEMSFADPPQRSEVAENSLTDE